MGNSKRSYITKQTNLCEVRKNELTKFTEELYNKKKIEQLDRDSNRLEKLNNVAVYYEI